MYTRVYVHDKKDETGGTTFNITRILGVKGNKKEINNGGRKEDIKLHRTRVSAPVALSHELVQGLCQLSLGDVPQRYLPQSLINRSMGERAGEQESAKYHLVEKRGLSG